MSEGYQLGRLVVAFHDQEGLTYDVTLETLRDRRRPVGLLGIVCEAAERNWPPRLVREVAQHWARLFAPTPTEAAALRHLGVGAQSAATSHSVAAPSSTAR